MELLETGIIIVHVLVSLALVGLVLLQQGKGAEAGASFGGGASQTVFGSQGSGSFLATATSWLAVVFFLTSISLAYVAKEKAEVAAAGGELIVPTQQDGAVPSALEAPDFGDDGEAVDYNQSIDEVKETLGKDELGFAAPVGSEEDAANLSEQVDAFDSPASEAPASQVPELE